jgi:RHS repeat-associated protein
VQERPVGTTAWTTLRSTTTDTVYDSATGTEFGNVELVTVTTAGGRTTTTDHTYRNDTDRWLIGLVTATTVTARTAGGQSMVRESTADYDPQTGNPTVSVTEPNKPPLKLTTTTGYDGGQFGVVTSITRTPATGTSRVEQVRYDADWLAPVATINAAGHRTDLVTHSGLGVVLKSTDPNGFVTATSYDGFGREREVKRSDNSFERTTHGVVGGWQQAIVDTTGGGQTVSLVDQLGRDQETRVKAFDGSPATTYTDYDTLGRVRQVSIPVFPGVPAQYTVTSYDALDRVTAVTAPDQVRTTTSYLNRETRVVDGNGVESRTVANPDGDVVTALDDDPTTTTPDRWYTTSLQYGPFGDITKITSPGGVPGAPGAVQTMQYDELGRRTARTDPASGTTTTTYSNHFGEVTTVTDAENRATTTSHDTLGRVTTAVSPDGTLTNLWDTAPMAPGGGQAKGLLARATSPDGTVTDHTYTDLAKPDTATWTMDGIAYQFDTDYDNLGRPAGLKYPQVPGTDPREGPRQQRLAITYRYNDHGYLDQVTNAADGTDYWDAQARDAAGRLTHYQYGNRVATVDTYNSVGLLTNSRVGSPTGATLSALDYRYDNNRNVIDRIDAWNPRREEYHHDSLNRLIQWKTTVGQNSATVRWTNYTYDEAGFLTAETDIFNQPQATYTKTATGHRMATRNNVSYQYNRAGQQTSGAGRTITYTTLGLPRTINWGQLQTTTYHYDAAGTRVRKTDSVGATTITINNLIERRNPAGTGSTDIHNIHNITVDGRVVAQITKVQNAPDGPVVGDEDPIRYLSHDQQGSTILITNKAGREVDNDEGWLQDLYYDPWGRRVDPTYQPLPPQRRGGPRQGYTGHYHDDDLGLINMQGRIYDPETRRFLSPDPITAQPLSSQHHNRYSYVHNNPTTHTDPTGHTATSNSGTNRLGNPLGSLHWAATVRINTETLVQTFLNNHLTAAALKYIGGGPTGGNNNTGGPTGGSDNDTPNKGPQPTAGDNKAAGDTGGNGGSGGSSRKKGEVVWQSDDWSEPTETNPEKKTPWPSAEGTNPGIEIDPDPDGKYDGPEVPRAPGRGTNPGIKRPLNDDFDAKPSRLDPQYRNLTPGGGVRRLLSKLGKVAMRGLGPLSIINTGADLVSGCRQGDCSLTILDGLFDALGSPVNMSDMMNSDLPYVTSGRPGLKHVNDR